MLEATVKSPPDLFLSCKIQNEPSKTRGQSLTYSHHPSQRPMYKGLKAREGLETTFEALK